MSNDHLYCNFGIDGKSQILYVVRFTYVCYTDLCLKQRFR